ncbi:CapA family protein [Vagococcus intermedius]|uniref:CapA family protein n=1 Tax=Vagococcus intermedius TaxID=2991418 RepID=A0AAF0I8Q7_9ENTE|nr:CapA family protein [Vagococcus intermedius]WEG74236.1 CapA family protein [Vagococcus intermedius]WEG76318.1 CapA family protein [Vagococcus intermedius]
MVVQHKIPDLKTNLPQLIVEDPYKLMHDLFVNNASKSKAKRVAISGTVGKSTTTKLIADALEQNNSVTRTAGNHNSRTGVKLTVLNEVEEAKFSVVEVAMNALNYGPVDAGVMEDVAVDLGVITEISFGQGGLDANRTIDLKTRIAYALKNEGNMLLCRDITDFDYLLKTTQTYTSNIYTYGFHEEADFQIKEVYMNELESRYKIEDKINQVNYLIDVALLDRGNLSNLTASIAALSLLEETITPELIDFLAQDVEASQTFQLSKTEAGKHQVSIIDDTKNAQYLSMKNFLNFAAAHKCNKGTKKIVALGRIIGLRGLSEEGHKKLLPEIINDNFTKVYTYGPEIDVLGTEIPKKLFGGHFNTFKDMTEAIAKEIDSATIIYVKGSRRDSDIHLMTPFLIKNLDYYKSGLGEFTYTSTTEVTENKHFSTYGMANLVLYYDVLRKIASKKLKIDTMIDVTKDFSKQTSADKVGLTKGQQLSLYDLLRLATAKNAPDAIITLAEHVYGSNKKASATLSKVASELGLNDLAVKNISGRRCKFAQRVYLTDLAIMGEAFGTIPYHYLSLINTSSVYYKGAVRDGNNQVSKFGKTLAVMYWGQDNTNGLVLTNKNNKISYVGFINNDRAHYADAFVDDYITTYSFKKKPHTKDKSVKLNQPIINILGDTYFGEYYTRARSRRGIPDGLTEHGYSYSFEKVAREMPQEEFNIINFEAVFADPTKGNLKGIKEFILDADADPTLAELKNRHVDMVSLATNHAMDFGADALDETLDLFNKEKILTVGAGKTNEEATDYVELTHKKQKIAIFNGYWYRRPAYAMYDFYAKSTKSGVACLTGRLVDKIKAYRQKNPHAKIVTIAHWGVDFKQIDTNQRTAAETLVNAGVDLIVGHGPHTIQPMEMINQTPVLYSIGNGIFNSNGEYAKHKALPFGYLVKWHLEDEALYILPIQTNNKKTFWQPDFVTEAEFKDIVAVNPKIKFEEMLYHNKHALKIKL